MKIIPCFDFVHIRKPRVESKTAGGIILPGEKTVADFQGTVLAIGPDVKHIKVGDVIIYKQYTSNKVPEVSGEYLVQEKDVLAIK